MPFPLITRAAHERALARLARRLTDTEAVAEAHRARANALREVAHDWKVMAETAQRALVELQRRYAPPEPIAGDITQPKSVYDADHDVLTELRERGGMEVTD